MCQEGTVCLNYTGKPFAVTSGEQSVSLGSSGFPIKTHFHFKAIPAGALPLENKDKKDY